MNKKVGNDNYQSPKMDRPIKKINKVNRPSKLKNLLNTPVSNSNKKSNFPILSNNKEAVDEEEQNCQILTTKIRIQNDIINQYQKWVGILLNIINDKKVKDDIYTDVGTPVQEGLEVIQNLYKKNYDIKQQIIEQKIKNENLKKQLEQKRKSQNMITKEFNEKDEVILSKVKEEKGQLEYNVQMLANELDELNENNKFLYEKIQKNDKMKKINDLLSSKNQLKNENKLLKQILVLKKRNNINDDYNNNKNLYKNNYLNENYGSLGNLSQLGEYKIEKEEHYNKKFFICGL